jgi:hydroxyquinol 1,2-dioxygenase
MTQDRLTSEDLTQAVLDRFSDTPDPRLREIMQSLVLHLHRFVADVELTQEEWLSGVEFLTATGHKCDDTRQEFILLSDVLGVSMLVDTIAQLADGDATESTVTGPFYVPQSPQREYGASIVDEPSGELAWVAGRVLDTDGQPISGAEVDVWQNGANMLYAVQDPNALPTNLRGLFRTRNDGSYAFLAVRPTAYPIPDDGPVGEMLTATARHPWRPAHLHMIVRAPGYQAVATHIFDDESDYLDSDAVFGVKPSLIRHFERHESGESGRPEGIPEDDVWYSLDVDVRLAPTR